MLFDVDGTLIDSNGAHAESWMRALAEHRVATDLVAIRRLIGMGGDKLLPAVADVRADSPLGLSITHQKQEIFGGLLSNLRPTPGARPLLEYLRDQGVKMAVATSADAREVSALLRRAGVDDLIPARRRRTTPKTQSLIRTSCMPRCPKPAAMLPGRCS